MENEELFMVKSWRVMEKIFCCGNPSILDGSILPQDNVGIQPDELSIKCLVKCMGIKGQKEKLPNWRQWVSGSPDMGEFCESFNKTGHGYLSVPAELHALQAHPFSL